MGSTERAPEPTMEEILASIRRIISDDEANNSAQQTAKTAEFPGQIRPEDADYEVADTQIIDDIARVLSGGATPSNVPPGAPAANDDDVLDLADLGGAMSEAAGEPIDVEMLEVTELTVIEDMVAETEIPTEPRKAPSFAAAFPPSYQKTTYQETSYQESAEAPEEFAEAPVSEAVSETPVLASGTEMPVSETPVFTSEAPAYVSEAPAFASESQHLPARPRRSPVTPNPKWRTRLRPSNAPSLH